MICSASCTISRRMLRSRRHLDVVQLERPAHAEQLLRAVGRRRSRRTRAPPPPVVRSVCSFDRQPRPGASPSAAPCPGFLRAWPRTNCGGPATASAAMPHHSADHRMCEYGTIVCAEMSANGPGRICSSAPAGPSLKPGLHVPRMPSRVPACPSASACCPSLRTARAPGRSCGSSVAAARDEDARRRARRTTRWSRPCRAEAAVARFDRADARARVAQGADLRRDRRQQHAAARPGRAGTRWKNALPAVARDAGDLDVVHRQHHRAGAARLRQRGAKLRELLEVEHAP